MILDNRQVVPDIIVSRDGVPNNSILYNININNANVDGGALGRGQERDSPRRNPRNRIAKHPYATGNNNGSPRHVPHNGNVYSDANRIANHGFTVHSSPVHRKVYVADGSQRDDATRNRTYNPVVQESPSHIPRSKISNEGLNYDALCVSPRHKVVSNLFSNSRRNSSPLKYTQQSSENRFLQSPKKVQSTSYEIENYENVFGSPKKSVGEYPMQKKYHRVSASFRQRSSSHPCENFNARQSKIPVHTGSRNKMISQNTSTTATPKNLTQKPLNRKLSIPVSAERILRKNIEHEQNQVESYNCNMSPKRFNTLNKNPVTSNLRGHVWRENKDSSSPKRYSRQVNKNIKHSSVDQNDWNAETFRWNWDKYARKTCDDCWNIDNDKSEEENDLVNTQEYVKYRSKTSKVHQSARYTSTLYDNPMDDSNSILRIETDHGISSDSGFETELSSTGSKMVLIKCKDANYLTRIFVNEEGIHGLKVVGRVGGGGTAQQDVMNVDQSATANGDLNSNHSLCNEDVMKNGDVIHRDALSENTTSLISQGTDNEFEHEAADYQWLLDYEYRESYSRDNLGCGKENAARVSVLQASQNRPEMSYEILSRNIDANLAEIDMDDFRSEDIHQLLSLPTMCGDMQDGSDTELYSSASGSMLDRMEFNSLNSLKSSGQLNNGRCFHHQQQLRLHQHLLRQRQILEGKKNTREDHCEEGERDPGDGEDDPEEEAEEELEEFSGVSGDISLYQSGPLFSPLKEPPQIPPSFSVDSLDSESIHEDLILTCQANKDNYTIAFEDSDYHVGSDSTGSGTWSTERLEGRSPAPNMTHSDQPYTTWSRVSRRSSQSHTPDPSHSSPARGHTNSPAPTHDKQHLFKASLKASDKDSTEENKSNSMPNLMRQSLMKRSLEASGQCIKVYDLQNSMRSSHLSGARSTDSNNFSLVRLFIKQKSLSKEAVSMSSSLTDPSQEGACSSSDNQSAVNDSSDWPMNSQSENDMEGSSSPIPSNGFTNHLNNLHSNFRGRGTSPNIMHLNQDGSTTIATTDSDSPSNTLTEGLLNNNNINSLTQVDNVTPLHIGVVDNIVSFEDSLKEANPCSKPPMTSPIREEPEGMDISIDSRCENKVKLDQSENERKVHEPLRLRDNKWNTETKAQTNYNIQTNKNSPADGKIRSQSPGTPKKYSSKKEAIMQRRRQDSGNSSSGYASNRGSTEKIRRSSDSDKLSFLKDKPKPKPRSLKQIDQCLQTSNLKVSATVNTSGILDKKDVYVYYPNYALPDLAFLKEKKYNVDARIFLVPQHYMTNPIDLKNSKHSKTHSKRPFSCGDMEKLRRQGFRHVKDWESLNFLLPKELKEMLLDETECMETTKPSFCHSKQSRKSTSSQGSTCSVNSTQPSSGFRGSSTLLNDSDSDTGTPLDLRYAYKHNRDSDNFDKPPPLPKRSVSLQGEDGNSADLSEVPPPRPPLPRGILRKCSSLKDYRASMASNKRNSAGDSGKFTIKEDLLKRRSLPEPSACQMELPETQLEETHEKSPTSSMRCSCVNGCTGFCGKGLRKKNLLQVTELPEVSTHEELNDDHFVRLRSQVSNFLATKGSQVGQLFVEDPKCSSCDCPRKSVSFAGRACNHQQKRNQVGSGAKLKDHQQDILRLTPEMEQKSSVKQSLDEDFPPMLFDAYDKKTLVLSVRSAVEKLVLQFNFAHPHDKTKSEGSTHIVDVSQIALDKLCPALYALLSDGLVPFLPSLFGRITNSVWKVVEATSQLGPSTKALNDLVMTLNSEDCLAEGPIKFNAFIFGLLNLRSLDTWLSYLRTREGTLQKHYHPEGFLYLSNTAMRSLYDDLLLALRPLALLPLQLDLLYEYKTLHASFLKMEERLATQVSQMEGASAEKSPHTVSKPLDQLLAAKETKEFRNVATKQDRVRALMRVLISPESDVKNSPSRERSKSPRPRSCFEDCSIEDVNPALKKRWSGIQLGSKLITAIDKLMVEELGEGASSSDYTDSLDNPRKRTSISSASGGHSSTLSDDPSTDMRISDISSRDGDVSERSATDKDTENEKGLLMRGKVSDCEESEGERFRRLQLKWEQMTVRPIKGSVSRNLDSYLPGFTLVRNSKTDGDKSISPGCVSRSRIPRPVSMTSPQKPFKTFDPSTERTSPHQRRGVTSPSDGKGTPKPAPRRSLKDRPTDHDHHAGSIRNTGVRSKTGSRSIIPSGVTGGSRASSVPNRSLERGSSSNRRVQTLHHRMATDNGHLSFNRGDILSVVVDVDEKYLLCCLNDRKGLVPRSSVVTSNQP